MVFLLVRIFPIFLPIIYFFCLRLLFIAPNSWWGLLIAVLFFNLVYFFLLDYKLKRRRIWVMFVHAEVFSLLGFAVTIILSSPVFIYTFTIVWSIIYLIYLESVFNYFYRTQQLFLVDLENITAYVNLLMTFFLFIILFNFYIFLSLAWWWVMAIAVLALWIIIFSRFLVFELSHRLNLIYSSFLTLVLVEFLVVLLWWPSSIYVLSLILASVYYLMSTIVAQYYEKKLTKKAIIQYIGLVVITLTIVLLTAQWL